VVVVGEESQATQLIRTKELEKIITADNSVAVFENKISAITW
jgi:hypothetical protein